MKKEYVSQFADIDTSEDFDESVQLREDAYFETIKVQQSNQMDRRIKTGECVFCGIKTSYLDENIEKLQGEDYKLCDSCLEIWRKKSNEERIALLNKTKEERFVEIQLEKPRDRRTKAQKRVCIFVQIMMVWFVFWGFAALQMILQISQIPFFSIIFQLCAVGISILICKKYRQYTINKAAQKMREKREDRE